MIKIFLTGALTAGGFQNNPANSHGGYISTVTLNNGDIDTLFSGISQFSQINNKPEYALISLQNVGKLKTQVEFKATISAGSLSTVDIALVKPSADSDGDPMYELTSNKYSAPFYADFSGGSVIKLPEFCKDKIYGIWIRRTPLSPMPVPLTGDIIAAYQNGTTLPTVDDMVVNMSYEG